MDFPKPLMSITELKKMGFSKDFLYRCCNSHYGRQFVRTKTDATNAKIWIDTKKFSSLLEKGVI